MTGVIRDIEVLRGVAILMVLIEHLPVNLLWWNSPLVRFALFRWHGGAGVDLFFAISGFVIARSLLPDLFRARGWRGVRGACARFWTRRAFRLLPAAWLWLALPLWLSYRLGPASAFGEFANSRSMAIFSFLNIANIYAAYTATLAEGHFQFYGTAFVYWSLSLEEQFYLLLPILSVILRSWLPSLLVILVVYQFVTPFTALSNLTRPGALATGVLLALAVRQSWYTAGEPRFLARSAISRLVLLAFSVAGLGLLETIFASWAFGATALLSGLLVFVASFDRGYLSPVRPFGGAFTWLGSRSYSLYLTHVPAFCMTREMVRYVYGATPPRELWLDVAAITVSLGVALLAAEITHRYVEAPSRALGRRLTRSAVVPPLEPYGVPT